jgi:hypothetical protein
VHKRLDPCATQRQDGGEGIPLGECQFNAFQSLFGICSHNMGLDCLFGVVLLKRRKVLNVKASAFGVEMKRDCGPEHRQTLAKRNNLLLMEPEQCTVHEFVGIVDGTSKDSVTIDRAKKAAQSCFNWNVLTARSLWHALN